MTTTLLGLPIRDRILEAIREGAARGRPYTYREIATRCGLTSTGHVTHYVNALEKAGLIRRPPNAQTRGLVPTTGHLEDPRPSAAAIRLRAVIEVTERHTPLAYVTQALLTELRSIADQLETQP